jgi:pheromone shutdown protein TraB
MYSRMAEYFPQIYRPLVADRDAYMAEQIRSAPGNTIVAVVGLGIFTHTHTHTHTTAYYLIT